MEEDEFLQRNRGGALLGGFVGDGVAGVAAMAGILGFCMAPWHSLRRPPNGGGSCGMGAAAVVAGGADAVTDRGRYKKGRKRQMDSQENAYAALRCWANRRHVLQCAHPVERLFNFNWGQDPGILDWS